MADMVTVQELENAKIDARTIGESVNENKIVTPRYGVPFKSMPMIAEEMQSVIGTIIAGGVPASIVLDAGGKSQQEINNVGGFWNRSVLSSSIENTFQSLDASLVDIWEFAEVVDKRGSTDAALWDWSPAINAAINYCTNFNATASVLKACPTLVFPYGTYTMFSKFTDMGISSEGPYQKTYNIKGWGLGATVIKSSIENDYMFELSNQSRMIVSDLSFSGATVANSKCLKLGDETATEGSTKYMHWCDFTRVYWLDFTQAITIGRLFDSSFNNCSFRGLKGSVTIPSYYISVLDQTMDSTNQLVFFRTGFESVAAKSTVFQNGSAFFKSYAAATFNTHYCFNFYGCHLEGGGQGVKLLDVNRALKFNFNGCYFVQTFERTDLELQTFIELNNVYNSVFDGCFFQEIASPASWNTANVKMIKIKGNTNGLKFANCHFKSAGINTSVTRSYETVFDYSEATHGENSFVRENCTLNSFTAVASGNYITLASKLNSSNRHTVSVDDDDNSLNFRYTNNDGDKAARGQSALRLTSASKVETFQDLNIGAIKTTAGDQRLNFATNGDGVAKAYINVTSTGATTFSSSFLTLSSNSGASEITVSASAFRPNASGVLFGTSSQRWGTASLASWDIHTHIVPTITATSVIGGASNTVKNIYLQNAPTIISDERHKSKIQDIPQAVLNAWSRVNFQMYKLNDAIEKKGDEAHFHFGVIAQRIVNEFDKEGLDWRDYSILTYETWDAVEAKDAVYGEDGSLVSDSIEAKPAGDVYMVRYEECFALEMAYQRSRIDKIEGKQF